MSEEMEWVEELKQLAGKTGVLSKSALEGLLNIFFLSEGQERKEVREELESLIELGLPSLVYSERPVLPAPLEQEFNGIAIGEIMLGDKAVGEFKLDESELVRHVAIYAQTGHGKSTLLYNLISQLIEKNIPFILFDLKNDGRALLRKSEKLVVIPWKRFAWNPLRAPPGMSREEWWANFSQICAYSFGWFVASSNYMLEHLERLREKEKPTIRDLFNSIVNTEETTRRRSEYHDVVENRVRAIVSIFRENFSVEEGIRIEKLLELPVVVELSGLRPAEANWLIEVLLSWIYFYRLYNAQRGERLRHVIIIDEAHRIFDRSKEYRETAQEMGIPMISIFPTQFRDFGTSLILTSQTPSFMMEAVHANTLVKIVGNLSNGNDIEAVSNAMGLDEETKECIHKLKRGQWIVRMSDIYTEPFLMESSPFQADKDVSDEEVEERLESIFGQSLQKKQYLQEREIFEISEDAWSLLLDVNQHPFRQLSTRNKELKLSWRRLEQAKAELLGKELLKESEVVLGNYRPVKYLIPTSFALSLLRRRGYDTRFWSYITHSGGGFEHRLHIVFLRNLAIRAGYQVQIEKLVNGKRVDLLLLKNGRKIGVEVQLKGIRAGEKFEELGELDELVIVVRDLGSLEIAMSEISPWKPRVKVYTLGQYAKLLYNEANLLEEKPVMRRKQVSSSSWRKAGEKPGEEEVGQV
ncbi:MAG: ATP-binding protein [Candidatus Brockarchaeota archaeon]|nr:ATP-binding protein [Candidatus Brockarchaeota archaeon]